MFSEKNYLFSWSVWRKTNEWQQNKELEEIKLKPVKMSTLTPFPNLKHFLIFIFIINFVGVSGFSRFPSIYFAFGINHEKTKLTEKERKCRKKEKEKWMVGEKKREKVGKNSNSQKWERCK